MNDGQDGATPGLGAPIADGEWAGWSHWTASEPFEDYAGPFYTKREAGDRIVCGYRLKPQSMNGQGSAHGGALMTFADYSLFMIATDLIHGENYSECVTVTMNAEFLGGSPLGALLTARGDVVKAGRSLVFVRGLIDHEGEPVLSFSGVVKRVKPRA